MKHEQNIDCGGGYAKIFPCEFDGKDMHGETPYNIMFGKYTIILHILSRLEKCCPIILNDTFLYVSICRS